MSDADVYASGNSYLGLARQASQGHTAQAAICRALLKRGHTVDGRELKKAFRRRDVAASVSTWPAHAGLFHWSHP